MRCDVCGLPDSYRGQGDGIGSCDCTRCECGAAHFSVFCDCPPDDGMCPCESYDCQGQCCGPGGCSCTPTGDEDDGEPWPDDVIVRLVETVELPGVTRCVRDPGAATVLREWTLTIPAPARWLNANSRADRRGWSGGVKTWRDAAHTYARQARLPKLQQAHILAELRFADNRRRDAHNFYPTAKAIVDGLVDYGLLPDDSTEFLDGPDLRIGAVVPKRPGRIDGDVVLTIREYVPKEET